VENPDRTGAYLSPEIDITPKPVERGDIAFRLSVCLTGGLRDIEIEL
jgi:hypothetical protein